MFMEGVVEAEEGIAAIIRTKRTTRGKDKNNTGKSKGGVVRRKSSKQARKGKDKEEGREKLFKRKGKAGEREENEEDQSMVVNLVDQREARWIGRRKKGKEEDQEAGGKWDSLWIQDEDQQCSNPDSTKNANNPGTKVIREGGEQEEKKRKTEIKLTQGEGSQRMLKLTKKGQEGVIEKEKEEERREREIRESKESEKKITKRKRGTTSDDEGKTVMVKQSDEKEVKFEDRMEAVIGRMEETIERGMGKIIDKVDNDMEKNRKEDAETREAKDEVTLKQMSNVKKKIGEI